LHAYIDRVAEVNSRHITLSTKQIEAMLFLQIDRGENFSVKINDQEYQED
jgi:hypothetical protein